MSIVTKNGQLENSEIFAGFNFFNVLPYYKPKKKKKHYATNYNATLNFEIAVNLTKRTTKHSHISVGWRRNTGFYMGLFSCCHRSFNLCVSRLQVQGGDNKLVAILSQLLCLCS